MKVPTEKIDNVLGEVLGSVTKHLSGLEQTASEALEGLLQQADKAMPDEEGLKDIARGFGVEFGDENKDGE